MEPFLHNHQYNRIARQAHVLLSAMQASTDPKVIEAARFSAVHHVLEACPGLSGERLQLVERLAGLKSKEESEAYLSELLNVTVKFPEMTESRLKGLFPKIKKLRMPDLSRLEGKARTYLGWTDPGTNRMFLVYSRQQPSGDKPTNSLVGIEGRFVPVAKRGICAFCNQGGDTVLFTAESKKRISHLPDYYKAVGQYICSDSDACNSRITDPDALERLFEAVTS